MSNQQNNQNTEKNVDRTAEYRKFKDQALQIEKVDTKIRTNGEKILNLYRNVKLMESAQKELDTNLDLILSQQSELGTTLTQLENKVSVLSTNFNPEGNSIDSERTKTANIAVGLAEEFELMMNDLSLMMDRINIAKGESHTSGIQDFVTSSSAQIELLEQHLSVAEKILGE